MSRTPCNQCKGFVEDCGHRQAPCDTQFRKLEAAVNELRASNDAKEIRAMADWKALHLADQARIRELAKDCNDRDDQIVKLEEQVRYYRRDWECACERANAADELRKMAQAEAERLRLALAGIEDACDKFGTVTILKGVIKTICLARGHAGPMVKSGDGQESRSAKDRGQEEGDAEQKDGFSPRES